MRQRITTQEGTVDVGKHNSKLLVESGICISFCDILEQSAFANTIRNS